MSTKPASKLRWRGAGAAGRHEGWLAGDVTLCVPVRVPICVFVGLLACAAMSGRILAGDPPQEPCEGPSRLFARIDDHAGVFRLPGMTTAELNGDGRADVVLAGAQDPLVVLSWEGGGFLPPLALSGPSRVEDLVLAVETVDLDGDGDLDVASAISRDSAVQDPVSTFFNLGGGSFEPGQANVVASVAILALTSGDFDGDGDADLVTAGLTGDMVLLVNTGLGALVGRRRWSAGLGIRHVVAADLDGDGDLDLVGASPEGRRLLLWRNGGNGVFDPPESLPLDGPPTKVAARDFDGDGDLDLLAAHGTGFSVLLNLGSGAFEPPVVVSSDGRGLLDVAAGDFDGDGDLDVATVTGNESIAVRWNEGSLRFSELLETPAHVTGVTRPGDLRPTPSQIASGDFTGNGRADFVVGYEFGALITFYLGPAGEPPDCNANGVPDVCETQVTMAAEPGAAQPLDLELSQVNAVTHADLDADGDADLIVADQGAGAVTILSNAGEGRFESTQKLVGLENPVALGTADFDGDGSVDVFVVASRSNTVSIFQNRGDGLLTAPLEAQLPGEVAVDAAAADLDGDGLADLVAVSHFSFSVALLFNEGDGSFLASQATAANFPTAVAVGDLDGDGLPDLVASTESAPTFFVYQNAGGRRFTRRPSPRSGGPTTRIVLVDVDRDGLLDIVSDALGGNVAVLHNRGSVEFEPALRYATALSPAQVIPANLNGDGLVDLLVLGQTHISALLGAPGVGFLPEVRVAIPGVLTVGTAVDLDGDGVIDFIGGDGGSLWMLRGTAPTASIADRDLDGVPDTCGAAFRRGDVVQDTTLDITDAVVLLGCLFLGEDCPECLSTADVDNDNVINVTDPIYLLVWLFRGGPAPPPPFPDCGLDPDGSAFGRCAPLGECR